MLCSTEQFPSSNSCKRGIEALKIVLGAQVMQVKFDREQEPTGAYQVFSQGGRYMMFASSIHSEYIKNVKLYMKITILFKKLSCKFQKVLR